MYIENLTANNVFWQEPLIIFSGSNVQEQMNCSWQLYAFSHSPQYSLYVIVVIHIYFIKFITCVLIFICLYLIYISFLQITTKFLEEQKYAEETEGSNLSNTDCENSSEDECNNTNKTYNKEFNNSNAIQVKRKKELSDDSENDLLSKKSKKTIYMESFNLTPCVVNSEDLNCINEVSCDNNKEIFDLTSKENMDNISLEKISDNTIEVTNESSKSAKKNMGNNDENKNNCINVTVKENTCIENNTNKTISKTPHENNIQVVKDVTSLTNDLNDCIVNIESEDNEPLIIEPEVIVHVGKSPVPNVIEINELDDSDVEITACDTPKVPVQNKKSLESIIKTSMFKLYYIKIYTVVYLVCFFKGEESYKNIFFI